MLINLKNYVRNQRKRKEYIHQRKLLLSEANVSKVKYDAGLGKNNVTKHIKIYINFNKNAIFSLRPQNFN